MYKLSVCVVFTVACIATGFAGLCTPDQWEGYEGSFGGYVFHRRPGIIKETVRVSYDATNQRSASFINYVNNNYENKFQIIVRYDKPDSGKIYVVDLKKDSCWEKKIDIPFRKACIPDKAKHIADYSLGLAGKGGLPVSGYELQVKDMSVSISVFKDGNFIIPIGETVYGSLWKTSFIQTVGFVGITPGIKNATVFDIPAQCQQKYDFSMAEFLTRQHFVLAL